MEIQKQQLVKLFSLILKKRASEDAVKTNEITPSLLKFFSRKELIAIIKYRFGGSIPKEHDLMEKENEELLNLIEDDMYIISYVTQKWCEEVAKKPEKVLAPKVTVNEKKAASKTTSNEKAKK
ncbi:hypothetical protein ACFSTE_09255 [Aquimarina hainanensis]|uniref:Uncharacterized protein n=1 Tax=Aquimarina hainanensis TaxID=1578017 RepID=A0ABW5N637_9FLAO